nr:hypothetical protein [Tenuifilaceae bacterium]
MKRILLAVAIIWVGLAFTARNANAQSEEELVQICGMIAGEAQYLKDFRVKLDAGDPPPVQRIPI